MRVTLDQIRKYCLKKKGDITEEFPFDDEALAFKVKGKIFLLMNITQHPIRINVKCDPERAIELRERYEAVQPGYHMNKKHWNTATIDGSISAKEIFEMIDHSFDRVVRGLKKADREKFPGTRRILESN